MPETNGTAAVDNSPSLAEFVGDIHGDFLTDEPESEAGASPAATPDTPASEGIQAAPAEASPAGAETVPDPNAQAPESDPLEGSTPLGYVVNGEQRTFEGITKLKDGGAIVDPDAVALLERRLGERDHLFESNRAQYAEIETLTKLTEWPVRGEDGQTRMLTGRDAVEAQRVWMGNAAAELTELRNAIKDPATLASLLLVEPDGQGGSRIVGVNEDALKDITRRVSIAQRENALQVRAAMARHGAPPARSAAPTPSFDAAASAPKAVDVAMHAANIPTLSAEDRKFLEAQAPRYIRPATAEDVRANPAGGYRVGEPIVDAAFVDVVKDRAQIRASTSATVSSASEAAKRNAANLAAANTGKKPVPRAPIAPPKDPTPKQQREDDEDAAFDRTMLTSAAVLRQPRTA